LLDSTKAASFQCRDTTRHRRTHDKSTNAKANRGESKLNH
jgi:hypothetical protein